MTAFLEAYLTNCSLTIRMSSCPLPRMQALLEVSSTLLSLHRVHPKHPRSCCSNMWSSLNSELEPTTEQLRVVHKPPNAPGTKASSKPKFAASNALADAHCGDRRPPQSPQNLVLPEKETFNNVSCSCPRGASTLQPAGASNIPTPSLMLWTFRRRSKPSPCPCLLVALWQETLLLTLLCWETQLGVTVRINPS